MSKRSLENKEVVYADCNGELVFLPEDLALELAQIHAALNTSKTWGEFKANVPAHVYQEVIEFMKEDEDSEALPQPEEAFDPHSIYPYEEGDWPVWPLQYMLEWMPEDIQHQFGMLSRSATSGPCLILTPEKMSEIVKALETQGYSCTENKSLVTQACGYL